MPAEQEARVIANDALEHDGWLDPVDMMRLARAYLALEAELLAAQEREKTLRHALTWVRGYTLAGETDHDKHIYEVVDKALVGSPSEKPGSEYEQIVAAARERCLRGQHDDPDNSGLCVRCGVVLDAD